MKNKAKPSITRRDFLNGVALGVAAGSGFSPLELLAQIGGQAVSSGGFYPPALQGLRGSHVGSFETGHAMRDGQTWTSSDGGDGQYDLVVVGGGISGLAAAYFYRKQNGPQSRILILDNHDDFGGHAKRNEFRYGDRMYLVNGGTLNVEAPSQYSTVAAGLLWELGIDRTRYFEKNRDMFSFYRNSGLQGSRFFDRESFGQDKLVVGYDDLPIAQAIAQSPLSDEAKRDVVRLYESTENYFPGLTAEQTREKLTRMSHKEYLLNVVKVHPDVVKLFQSSFHGSLVVGPDAIPAIYFRDNGFPGFAGLNIDDLPPELLINEPGGAHGRENRIRANSGDPDMYFPDGNATITRLLVRALVPGVIEGQDMDDIVTASADYSRLDLPENNVRIRLNSTAVNVQHQNDNQVITQYVTDGRAYSVRSDAVVMACWHTVIPHICPELPVQQKQALSYGSKSPLVYGGALLRNWRAFVDAGISSVTAPTSFYSRIGLQASVSMGDYKAPRDPDEPIVLRFSAYFDAPGRGLNRREQHLAGRREMLATSFDSFEEKLRDQLMRSLGSAGFDDERDIVGLTVNRWPHGYSYSYNPLDEPAKWAYSSTDERPCIVGSKPVGRITIANSDAAASPHTDAAINEAYRAVSEVLHA